MFWMTIFFSISFLRMDKRPLQSWFCYKISWETWVELKCIFFFSPGGLEFIFNPPQQFLHLKDDISGIHYPLSIYLWSPHILPQAGWISEASQYLFALGSWEEPAVADVRPAARGLRSVAPDPADGAGATTKEEGGSCRWWAHERLKSLEFSAVMQKASLLLFYSVFCFHHICSDEDSLQSTHFTCLYESVGWRVYPCASCHVLQLQLAVHQIRTLRWRATMSSCCWGCGKTWKARKMKSAKPSRTCKSRGTRWKLSGCNPSLLLQLQRRVLSDTKLWRNCHFPSASQSLNAQAELESEKQQVARLQQQLLTQQRKYEDKCSELEEAKMLLQAERLSSR